MELTMFFWILTLLFGPTFAPILQGIIDALFGGLGGMQ